MVNLGSGVYNSNSIHNNRKDTYFVHVVVVVVFVCGGVWVCVFCFCFVCLLWCLCVCVCVCVFFVFFCFFFLLSTVDGRVRCKCTDMIGLPQTRC